MADDERKQREQAEKALYETRNGNSPPSKSDHAEQEVAARASYLSRNGQRVAEPSSRPREERPALVVARDNSSNNSVSIGKIRGAAGYEAFRAYDNASNNSVTIGDWDDGTSDREERKPRRHSGWRPDAKTNED